MKPIIRVPRRWKDIVTGGSHEHCDQSRRDFLGRGVSAGVISLVLPKVLMGSMVSEALGACPPPSRTRGALAQIFSEGGPTMGARFITLQQANMMTAAIASNYGITAANVVPIAPGSSAYVANNSPFAIGLGVAGPNGVVNAPSGYTQADWNAVLAKVSFGGHFGAFNQDDGGGVNTGLIGAASIFKRSLMDKDIRFGNSATLARWAVGVPSAGVAQRATPANLSTIFSLTPASGNNTAVATTMTNAAVAARSLSEAFAAAFGLNTRKGGTNLLTSANCGFIGNAALADPAYGANLFTPANIPDLADKLTLANLTQAEQGLLSSFYRSADGTAGGVFIQYGGRDYHGNNGNDIAPKDYEEGRAIAMFLAACDRANSKGSLVYLSNGQAIAGGTQAGNITRLVNGANTTVATVAPRATGDAGGAYNGGLLLCFDPVAAPPVLRASGTFNSDSGNVTSASGVTVSAEAVAGLYLTALKHIGMDTSAAEAVMRRVNLATNPSAIYLA